MSIAAINPSAWTLATVVRGDDDPHGIVPPRPRTRELLSGYAMPFDQWSALKVDPKTFKPCKVAFAPGCFRESLAAIEAGRREVPIIVSHGRDGLGMLASSKEWWVELREVLAA